MKQSSDLQNGSSGSPGETRAFPLSAEMHHQWKIRLLYFSGRGQGQEIPGTFSFRHPYTNLYIKGRSKSFQASSGVMEVKSSEPGVPSVLWYTRLCPSLGHCIPVCTELLLQQSGLSLTDDPTPSSRLKKGLILESERSD